MKKILLLTLLFFSVYTYAQKEANFWYFGQNAALDFNSGAPAPVTGSALSTVEGCSSFSDVDGNLLFYIGAPNPTGTNLTIWNRNNQPMPNGTGLQGDASSSQSALTVPAPGRPNVYYIFTVGANSSGNAGFWYYTLDMNLDGGLGDISGGPIALNHTFSQNAWTEKVTAVRAADCNEFWVISLVGNSFLAYKVDGTGVANTPIVSTLAGIPGAPDRRGYLKVSPDGQTLVSASMMSGTYIFKFDDTTGDVSNYETFSVGGQLNLLGQQGYGVEFSPSSQVLYVSTGQFTSGSTEILHQFDLTQTTVTDINNSRFEVHRYTNSRGALQLGPDNKLYWTSDQQSNISVVNDPNELGAACNYSHQSVSLGTGVARQGLPPFLSSLLLPVTITDTNTGQSINNQTLQYCIGDSKTLEPDPSVIAGSTGATYEWLFDDGSTRTVVSTSSSLVLTNITTANAGDYELTINLTDACGNLTELSGGFVIGVFEPPVALTTPPTDEDFCDLDGDLVINTPFDLTTKDTEIIETQDPTTFEVVYFSDAGRTTLIPNPTAYTNVNATETIYARLRNILAPDACYVDAEFEIRVTGQPTPTAPTDYIACDNTSVGTDIDGFTNDTFLLSSKDSEILGGLSAANYTVTYHTTLVGAQTSSTTDVIDKTVNYQNTTAFSQTVYVRVENNANAGCNDSSLTLNLVVVPQPKSNAITNILSCSSTGTEVYDLHALKDAEMLAGQDPTIFNVVYYPTQNDALNDTNRLPTPNAYSNLSAYSTDTIWARTFHTAHPTTCVDVNIATTSFQIFVTQDPDGLIQTPVDVSDCDDTADGDDTNGFINNFITLSSKDAEILNNVAFANTALYTVSYHRSSADATNDANPIDKVNPYTNETANNQTIYVRVEHNDNPLNCVAYTNFDLIVHPLPVYATTNIVDLKQCDDDTDGFSDFNLTEANILISADHLNETFVYYPTLADAQADTNPIANPIAFTNRVTPTDIVWARAITVNGCYRIAQVNLIVSTTGIPATFSRTFNTCDDFLPTDGVTGANDDTDGVSLFDFSSVDAEVRALFPVTQQLTITYYRNNADALAEINAITDISNYRNIGYPGSQSIYIRVDSNLDNGCLGFGPYITLNVDPVPVANPVGDYALCETLDDGDGTNGIIQTFDLESQTAAILGSQNPANYTVTYHASAADALSGANSLASPYTNTVRDRQTIYVRVTGSAAGCFTNHTTFDIVVDPLPVANFVPDLEVCDDNSDGSARNGFSQSIDLESQTAGILGTQDPTQFTVTYHRDLAEAQAGTNPQISPFSNTTPNRQTIYVRVYNSITQCANGISNFDVVVNPEPIFDTVSNLSVCDDNDDGDDANGFVQDIDLNSQIPDILGPTQDPDDFNVTFHESQADATSGMNPFANPFSNTIANQQTIYVRIQNKATGCVNDDASFEVIVNPLPDFQVTTPQIVCLNGPTLTIRVENPADIYDYVWTDPNGNNIVGSFLTISSGGLYTITATTTNGTGCTRTRTIQVNESIIATITQDDVTIVDDSDNNSITIDPTNLGIGDYEYALTNENNVMIRNYQDQPLFENLEGGFYNILVRDKNGCGEVSLLVSVVEFPKFFTPNNDGVNDTWIVKGANSTFFPESSIYIFNRYGKVVANIPIDSQGWTGDYGGNRLPSDDYWFSIRLVDPNGTIRERKGNFSLLRK